MNDQDALWSEHGLVHRMEILAISFEHRACALVHYGHKEMAEEAKHAAHMIRFVLKGFQTDYDAAPRKA